MPADRSAACVFPRCVDGEKPPHCGHDCDKREQPYAHEYGAEPSAAYTPCTCTVACIPQGITDEQTCRLQLENESIRVRDLRHLPSCAIYNGSPACSCLAVAEAVKRGAA